MGKGKARRRRQANYESAHRSGQELAPPPSSKEINFVPSKLRQIMNFMAPKPPAPPPPQAPQQTKNSRKEKKSSNKEPEVREPQNAALVENSQGPEPKAKKRKRNGDFNLLGDTLNDRNVSKGIRERQKRYLKEKKNKKKQKVEDDNLQRLYQHEDVPFGEVVQAPPKLANLPRAPKKEGKKTAVGVSQERLRVQAVEAYRKKRAWDSRPGISISQI